MTNLAAKNTAELTGFFRDLLSSNDEGGDIGVASFREVFDNLLPVQQCKLQELAGERFQGFYDSGSIVSIAVSYKDPIIDYINSRKGEEPDYKIWNNYALEYDRINQVLNKMSRSIAERYSGIPLTATIGGIIGNVHHVHDYFGMVISHRAIAEHAGIGWRGKNQLIIHEKYSCAIRFASIIVPVPLKHGSRMVSKCGSCTACEDACTFIKYRDVLKDYRENCRRYIAHLMSKGIEKDVCGKCIKACYRSSAIRNQFSLPQAP
jgi:epoxyqueuosine reductase QueG